MPKFVFVGDRAEVLDTPYIFRAFGQECEMDQEYAERLVVDQNLPIIPGDLFITTKSSMDQQKAARMALHEYREALSMRAIPAEENHDADI